MLDELARASTRGDACSSWCARRPRPRSTTPQNPLYEGVIDRLAADARRDDGRDPADRRPGGAAGGRGARRAATRVALVVPERAIDAQSLIAFADLVVSAGGHHEPRGGRARARPSTRSSAASMGAVDERLIAEGRLRPLASTRARSSSPSARRRRRPGGSPRPAAAGRTPCWRSPRHLAALSATITPMRSLDAWDAVSPSSSRPRSPGSLVPAAEAIARRIGAMDLPERAGPARRAHAEARRPGDPGRRARAGRDLAALGRRDPLDPRRRRRDHAARGRRRRLRAAGAAEAARPDRRGADPGRAGATCGSTSPPCRSSAASSSAGPPTR